VSPQTNTIVTLANKMTQFGLGRNTVGNLALREQAYALATIDVHPSFSSRPACVIVLKLTLQV